MRFLIGMTALLGPAALLALLFRKKIEDTLAPAVHLVILLLYGAGLLGLLRWGTPLVLALGLCSLAGVLWYGIRKKQWAELGRQLFCPGLVVFGAVVVGAMLLLRGRMLSQWDEFSHWGLVVKNMLVFDQMGNAPGVTTYFEGYPPAAALLEYFFASLGRPALPEAYLYGAMDLWVAALLVGAMSGLAWKNWKTVLLRGSVLFLLPLSFFEGMYHSIYVDGLLGLLFASAVLGWFREEEHSGFSFLRLGLCLAALVLVKESGTGLAVAALLLAGAELLWRSRHAAQKTGRTPAQKAAAVLVLLFPLAACLAAKLSWNWYLGATGAGEAWNTSGITASALWDALRGKLLPYQVETLHAFGRALMDARELGQWTIPPVMYLVLLLAAGVLLIVRQATKPQKQRMLLLQVGLAVSGLVYTLGLLVLYLFTYSEYEAQQVASFSRYMGTLLLGWALIQAVLLLELPGSRRFCWGLSAGVLAFCLAASGLRGRAAQSYYGSLTNQQTQEMRQPFAAAEQAQAQMDYHKDKVYFVCQNSQGREYWITRYSMTPVSLQPPQGWSLGQPYHEGDVWSQPMTSEQWQQLLLEGGYHYVYLYRADERFSQEYGQLFGGPQQVQGSCFYRVEPQTDGSVRLVRDAQLV